jgi:serpin B
MLRTVIIVLFGALLVACSNTETLPMRSNDAPGELVASSRPRSTSPDTTAEELEQLTADNSDFAWAFYREAAQDGQNLFFSPHSLSVALAMTWAGARGTTETEMADALRYRLGQARLHPAFNALDLELAKRAEEGGENAPQPFRLRVTNALFGQTGFSFLAPFLDTLAEHYGAGLWLMDFVNETEESRLAINAWVSGQTEQRIEELLQQGILNAMTRLVLVNTIYFNASWAFPFDPEATRDDRFTLLDGTELQTATMHRSIGTRYAEGAGYQAVELLYDGANLSMVVIVPDEGSFSAVESTLSAERVSAIQNELRRHAVELAFPKFEFRSQVMSKAPLAALGMRDAFTTQADLSGMTGERDLLIQDVVHEGFVAVDETGTEAAAATAVLGVVVSIPPPATLTIDRPFIFTIIDRPTGATLFVGRVLDPTR